MKGKIDILVATQYFEGKFVQIFRSLYYTYTPGDLKTPQTDVAKVYWLLKDNISRINVGIDDYDAEGILQNISHIEIAYTKLLENLTIVQERLPRLLITFYEKIESLSFNTVCLMNIHANSELLNILGKTKEVLGDAKIKIMAFWKERPEIFLRLPLRIIEDEMTDLFHSELYLPYILGKSLPLWNDPLTIYLMNETRKRIQGKEQRENYFVILRLITSDFDCWTIKRIVEYIPMTFDLMISQTPWEFSSGKSRDEDDISIYVS